MRHRATTLPSTLLLATVVLTVCCADGGALLRYGLLPSTAGDLSRADLRSSETRARAAAARHERPARPAIRPTALHTVPDATPSPATLATVAVAPPLCKSGASLSFSEQRLPPPAAA